MRSFIESGVSSSHTVAKEAVDDAGTELGVFDGTGHRAAWSEDDVADFEERAGMLTFDAGMAPSDAEREAERLVRLAHTRAFVGRAALIHHDFDESVDTPAGGAVAPFPGRGAARTGAP